jgi:hypothetical protein
VKPKPWGQSSSSFEDDLYLNNVAEHTHTIDLRQRIAFYDRQLAFSTAALFEEKRGEKWKRLWLM